MLKLYHMENSRSIRILWLLEELGLEYDLVTLLKGQPSPEREEMERVSPTGEVPCLIDGDRVLVESGVILDYLLRKFGQDSEFSGNNEKEADDIRYALIACESNMMISLIQLIVFYRARQAMPVGVSFLAGKLFDKVADAYARPTVLHQLSMLDKRLAANGGWFTGNHPSGADVMYHFVIFLNQMFPAVPDLLTRFPNIAAWDKAVRARPAFQRAIEPKVKLTRI